MNFRMYRVVFVMIVLILLFPFLCKNANTYNNRVTIVDAIYKYKIDMKSQGKKVEIDYDDIKSYDKTLWNLFDWGYENILPPDKNEIIKKYIR